MIDKNVLMKDKYIDTDGCWKRKECKHNAKCQNKKRNTMQNAKQTKCKTMKKQQQKKTKNNKTKKKQKTKQVLRLFLCAVSPKTTSAQPRTSYNPNLTHIGDWDTGKLLKTHITERFKTQDYYFDDAALNMEVLGR